jgi:hypothetical protein
VLRNILKRSETKSQSNLENGFRGEFESIDAKFVLIWLEKDTLDDIAVLYFDPTISPQFLRCFKHDRIGTEGKADGVMRQKRHQASALLKDHSSFLLGCLILERRQTNLLVNGVVKSSEIRRLHADSVQFLGLFICSNKVHDHTRMIAGSFGQTIWQLSSNFLRSLQPENTSNQIPRLILK